MWYNIIFKLNGEAIMISTASIKRKDQLYGQYLSAKNRQPDADCAEIDRLFTLLESYVHDGRIPKLFCTEVLDRINVIMNKTFPWRVNH
jgi:hypothetical protein